MVAEAEDAVVEACVENIVGLIAVIENGFVEVGGRKTFCLCRLFSYGGAG